MNKELVKISFVIKNSLDVSSMFINIYVYGILGVEKARRKPRQLFELMMVGQKYNFSV